MTTGSWTEFTVKAQKDILNKELIGFEFDGFNEAFTSQR